MTYICSECGSEIPDDMDFCPRCGCVKTKAFRMDGDGRLSHARCPGCGHENSPGDTFCGHCGERLQTVAVPMVRMRKNGTLALILALIPGFFNVFGLGHLLMRSWSRGAMYLAISAVLWYVDPWPFGSNMMIMVISVMVYMFQAFDVFRLIYSPEAK